jgi:branched-chain amino acid aminotransferase
MFRPMHNMTRMLISAQRSCLPEFDPNELVQCIRKLIQLDQEWVPHSSSSSLYIRPTMIGTEPTLGVAPSGLAEIFVILSPVGPYFSSGVKPVNLLADPKFVRAWPGGSGYAKMGSNYAPTMWMSVRLLRRKLCLFTKIGGKS